MNFGLLDFADDEWGRLRGGYRVPYDPRKALKALEAGEQTDAAWKELWNELHHQGDVGEASYAAVPHLVRIHGARGVPDWNTFALAATIEEARHNGGNPDIPERLQDAYQAAWRRLVELGLQELLEADDSTLITSILAALAMGKGQLALGRFAILFDEEERKELLVEAGW